MNSRSHVAPTVPPRVVPARYPRCIAFVTARRKLNRPVSRNDDGTLRGAILHSNLKQPRVNIAATRMRPACEERGGRRADKRRPVLNAALHCWSAAASRRAVHRRFRAPEPFFRAWTEGASPPPIPQALARVRPGHRPAGLPADPRSGAGRPTRSVPVSACEADSRRRTPLRSNDASRERPSMSEVKIGILAYRNFVKADWVLFRTTCEHRFQ